MVPTWWNLSLVLLAPQLNGIAAFALGIPSKPLFLPRPSTVLRLAHDESEQETRSILRTLTLVDPASDTVLATGYELAALPRERDKPDEDELEILYPTQRQYFQFDNSAKDGEIHQVRTTSFGCGKLGHQVWPSSLALCLWLVHEFGGSDAASLGSVLELGAGCGLPSIVCRDALKVPMVVATDFWYSDEIEWEAERLVPEVWHGINLKYNVQRPEQGALVRKLDWHGQTSVKEAATAIGPTIDLVIGSDLIYYPMDLAPLWNTLETLLKDCGARKIVLVSPLKPETRESMPAFLELVESKSADGSLLVERQEMLLYRSQGAVDARQDGDRFVKLTLSLR